MNLTDKQRMVLAYMENHTVRRYPTIRKIAKHFGLSIATIHEHISALRKKGNLSEMPRHELRYDPDGRLDEVFAAHPRSVHFEVMSDTSIWCGITIDDKRSLRIWINSKNGKAHIQYSAEMD